MSGEWRPIETAPKDGTFIMLYVPNGQLETGPVTIGIYFPELDELRDELGRFKKQHPWAPAHWKGWLGTDGDNSPSWCEPTHWMPLPKPPESCTVTDTSHCNNEQNQ
jgi:hypothetical protein